MHYSNPLMKWRWTNHLLISSSHHLWTMAKIYIMTTFSKMPSLQFKMIWVMMTCQWLLILRWKSFSHHLKMRLSKHWELISHWVLLWNSWNLKMIELLVLNRLLRFSSMMVLKFLSKIWFRQWWMSWCLERIFVSESIKKASSQSKISKCLPILSKLSSVISR